jgi:hypothetical protein
VLLPQSTVSLAFIWGGFGNPLWNTAIISPALMAMDTFSQVVLRGTTGIAHLARMSMSASMGVSKVCFIGKWALK